MVVRLFLRPGLDNFHGAVFEVHESQHGDVDVSGEKFAEVQRVCILQQQCQSAGVLRRCDISTAAT